MGSSTENSAFGVTRNPWDTSRVPGGSSGGPAAAVAAGEAILSLGSDTGGSIRQPAGFCGVVGLKPTYGRVSRYGLIAFASSLDQIGPLPGRSRTPPSPGGDRRPRPLRRDELTCSGAELPGGVDRRRPRDADRVAREYSVDGMEPEVERSFAAAVEVLRGLGAEVVEVSLPHTRYAMATYYITAPAECSANLARFDGVRFGLSVDAPNLREMYRRTRSEGFGAEVKRRIMLGTYALSSGYYDAYYVKAQKVRTLIKRDFDEAFAQVDAIVAPTSPTVAFPIGARTDDPVQMYLADVFTIPANMAGIPGVAIPCGFSAGLPISMQVLGPAFDEATILKVADAYERATEWKSIRPPV
jgi:aspartyl-tRNA(Asn)/glutamyl-tRNA(Gln) amidotransferase subunit A